jgi:hypothetical protein
MADAVLADLQTRLALDADGQAVFVQPGDEDIVLPAHIENAPHPDFIGYRYDACFNQERIEAPDGTVNYQPLQEDDHDREVKIQLIVRYGSGEREQRETFKTALPLLPFPPPAAE